MESVVSFKRNTSQLNPFERISRNTQCTLKNTSKVEKNIQKQNQHCFNFFVSILTRIPSSFFSLFSLVIINYMLFSKEITIVYKNYIHLVKYFKKNGIFDKDY